LYCCVVSINDDDDDDVDDACCRLLRLRVGSRGRRRNYVRTDARTDRRIAAAAVVRVTDGRTDTSTLRTPTPRYTLASIVAR